MNKKIVLLISSIVLLFNGCSNSVRDYNDTSNIINDSVSTTTEEIKKDSIVNLVAVGDNLIHEPIYTQAHANSKDGTYNFDYPYQYIEDYIKPADLAVLNQETPIANDIFKPSTYPQFNSPTQLGDKMIDMGFNVVSHSNNHILDKGEKGLLATIDYWESRNILMYGAYKNKDAVEDIPVMEVNGIKFSFVGFMEHTNGLSLPKNATAQLVYTSETDTMERLIKKAGDISDVVVVSVHWGVEVTNEVTDLQKNLARDFVDWGADLIIGTQPHTIQTMEYMDKPDGGQAFVTYCLGNFLSCMSRNLAMIGEILNLDIVKNAETGEITFENIKAIPIISHYDSGFKNAVIYPYKMYTEKLALAHGVKKFGIFNMKLIDEVIDENIPKEFLSIE